jgi:hypothetical protein
MFIMGTKCMFYVIQGNLGDGGEEKILVIYYKRSDDFEKYHYKKLQAFFQKFVGDKLKRIGF